MMDPLYGLMLFGVAFFGFMVVVGVVKARRKKEKAYYISAVLSFLMLLSSIFVILNQFVLVLVLFIAIGILGIAGFPKTIEAVRREPLKELQETDLSAPLRVRELLTWKGWFKLVSRWGVRKAMCFYSVLNMAGVGAAFFTFSISGMISTVWAIGFTIIAGILSPIFFHHQVGKALKRSSLEKRRCSQCRYFAYLNPYFCETLDLARNPFSLWLRLRLGYGACMRKKKLIRHRASICSDYKERRSAL